MQSDFFSLYKYDLFRYEGKINKALFLKHLILNPGYKYTFFMRICNYYSKKKYAYPFFVVLYLLLRHYEIKYGISIPYNTKIGPGLYIGHFGNIIVHPEAIIGKNCNLSQGVTIGVSRRGQNKGCPTIGNEVYIGPGAKLFGAIKVGNNVAIGANCVVTKDVPDNAVVVGVPGKVISYKGTEGYINNIQT